MIFVQQFFDKLLLHFDFFVDIHFSWLF